MIYVDTSFIEHLGKRPTVDTTNDDRLRAAVYQLLAFGLHPTRPLVTRVLAQVFDTTDNRRCRYTKVVRELCPPMGKCHHWHYNHR